jgi:hypothetical protein
MLLGALVAAGALLVAAACGDESVPPDFDDVVEGRVEIGTVVTVEGEATRIIASDALLVSGDDAQLLVIDAPEAGRPAVGESDEVVVTGAVRRLTPDVLEGAAEGGLVAPPDLADVYIEADLVRERMENRGG